MDLIRVENELKKRWQYPYRWGRKQSDSWDEATNFIYTTYSFKTLLKRVEKLPREQKDYALNRWYNFWSAQAVEYIFEMHSNVTPNRNGYDKLVDFSINQIPFDHKTSVFPKGFHHSYQYARSNERDLLYWLYRNQSQQGRKHLENRLFIILYNAKGDHWKMKAEIRLLKSRIDDYVTKFRKENLHTLALNGKTIYSDIIWVTKGIAQ